MGSRGNSVPKLPEFLFFGSFRPVLLDTLIDKYIRLSIDSFSVVITVFYSSTTPLHARIPEKTRQLTLTAFFSVRLFHNVSSFQKSVSRKCVNGRPPNFRTCLSNRWSKITYLIFLISGFKAELSRFNYATLSRK